jgi:hypothetical protein
MLVIVDVTASNGAQNSGSVPLNWWDSSGSGASLHRGINAQQRNNYRLNFNKARLYQAQFQDKVCTFMGIG